MKVFLGGTCEGREWRKELIPMLKIDFFNPLVDDWTEECKAREIQERKTCDFVLYTITSGLKGVYSIAEVIDDSNKRPQRTLFCVLYEGFDEKMTKSLKATEEMVIRNGGKCFKSLNDVAKYLNTMEADPVKAFTELL